MVEIKENDMFTLDSDKYITLSKIQYFDNDYIFTNKLDSTEEPTNDFVVFKLLPEGLVEEKKEEVLGPLLAYFNEFVNDKLATINASMGGDIDDTGSNIEHS